MNSNQETTAKSTSHFARAASWLGLWAVTCAAMFALRQRKVWAIVGESFFGLLIGYLVLWLGGALLFFAFSQLDRIRSEGLKFIAQLFLCLVVTIVIGGVIVVLTV